MNIRFHTLTLHNYKAHRDLIVQFGDVTRITGDNAQGKSSILEAIPFILYGTDVLGSKTDPTPTNYSFDSLMAELLLSKDGNQYLLARGIEKGKPTYYLNEVPVKATEYDDFIKSLFDKDLFLSLFNPSYFFSLHWETQRKLMLQYVTTPANKEVFAEMSRTSPDQKQKDIQLNPQAAKLTELVKKHSLDDLQKIHSKNKTDKDKAYISAQSRTKTLQEQLQRVAPVSAGFNIEAAEAELLEIAGNIAALQDNSDAEQKVQINTSISRLQVRYDSLLEQVRREKQLYTDAKDKLPTDTCNVCGQPLKAEDLEKAKAVHTQQVKAIADRHNKLISDAKEVRAELDQLKAKQADQEDEPDNSAQQLELHYTQRMDLQAAIADEKAITSLRQQIKQAETDEAATLASRNESIFILDAVKAYNAKEAELMAAKVQGLFTTLSLRLFKVNKTDGEIKPDFEIEMDDKPYRKLSRSEGVRAGLELREVLSKLSEIVAPCAVDDSESVFRIKKPSGQLIKVQAIIDQLLKIETEDAKQ